jgi:CrcB protein
VSGPPDPELDVLPRAGRRPPGTVVAGIAAIAAGGALGGLARYAAVTAAPPGGGFPWATLAVNLVGAFVVGVLATRIADGRLSERVRPFAITGVCGGLTTFSTVMTEVDLLVHAGRAGLAATYLAVTVVAGGTAALLGLRAGGER